MAEIGTMGVLTAVETSDYGLYLDGGDLGKILLPNRYVKETFGVGSAIDVFIYHDSLGRLTATTICPDVVVGSFALLKCASVSEVGAFMEWGLAKDLFVPFAEQNPPMRADGWYVVRVYLDSSHRIAASAKVDKFLGKSKPDYESGAKVSILVAVKTDLGFKAIVDDAHWGVIYQNEVFRSLTRGERMDGYIKELRPDGKIDLSLQPIGQERVLDLSDRILAKLVEKNGFLPITDKSPPPLIYDAFQVSKQTFKQAVGKLYKARRIAIEQEGIRLLKNDSKVTESSPK